MAQGAQGSAEKSLKLSAVVAGMYLSWWYMRARLCMCVCVCPRARVCVEDEECVAF